MIIVTKFMDKTATLPARVQATVLGRHGRKMHATVPWRSTLHSAQNHRRALSKLLKRLRGSGDVKGLHDCVQVEVIGIERYWAVLRGTLSYHSVDETIRSFEETTKP